MKRMCEAKKLMSNAGSFEKSGRLREHALREREAHHQHAHEPVEDHPGRERGRDRRIAARRDRHPRQEQLRDVAAAEREHVVDRVADHVGAPDVAPADASPRVRGPDRVEQRPRAQQQVQRVERERQISSDTQLRFASCEKNCPAVVQELADRGADRRHVVDSRVARERPSRSGTPCTLHGSRDCGRPALRAVVRDQSPLKRPGGPRSIWTPRRVREVGAQFPDRQGRVSPSQACSKPKTFVQRHRAGL